jgi:hypothetical protein
MMSASAGRGLKVRASSRNRRLTVRMHSRRDLLVVNCAQEPSLISTQRRLFREEGQMN